MVAGGHSQESHRVPDDGAASEFYCRFDLLEELGCGASSVVRRCIDRSTGQEYAAKIIDVSIEDVHEGLSSVEQVHREIALLRKVDDHPYVTQLVEVFETPDFIFLIFELLRKGELYEFLNSNVHLSEKRIRSYMKQLLLAVKHCHDNGVIHRDLKPENILIQDDLDHIKLTDFGLARPLGKNEKLYQICGTPGYLAPEIYHSGMFEKTDPRCIGYSYPVDAWACGVTLFTLLLGRPPFYDRRKIRMIKMICDTDHGMTGTDWDTITDEAKDLINWLLDKNPESRMTIDEALDHDVFTKSAMLRRLNHPEYANDEDGPEISTTAKSQRRKSSVGLKSIRRDPTVDVEDVQMAEGERPPPEKASPTARFRRIGNGIRFLVRLTKLKDTPELISAKTVGTNPYSIDSYRRKVDNVMFGLYHHWLKKSDVQSRASMFQNHLKFKAAG